MNKRLDEALTKVRALSEEEQEAAADILLEYVEAREAGTWLTREQVEEIERRIAHPLPHATDDDVGKLFDRLTK